MQTSRRDFLMFAGAASLGFVGLQRLLSTPARAGMADAAGYGPLIPDPDGVLDLPAGFRYDIISKLGQVMDDGLLVPGKADGMAAFPGPDGTTVLVRNHEISNGDVASSPFGVNARLLDKIGDDRFFDRGEGSAPSLGGTTNIVYDTKNRRVVRQFLSLAGTIRNCAGGPTPWGSWLTCEETVLRRGQQGCTKDHGWVFEVPGTAEVGLAEPKPILAMGRFNHEAVCVDPRTSIVYLTEDTGDGLLYRFVPNTPEKMHAGGRLEALVVRGRPSLDTRNWRDQTVATSDEFEVEWMPLENIEAPEDDLRHRGFEAGAARFARGEGIVWTHDAAYVVCTSGGKARKGQVFKYVPSPAEGTDGEKSAPGRLSLFIEPNDVDLLDMPDNAGAAPWGDILLCEDGGGEQFVRGVTPDGRLYKFCRNAKSNSEFAGVCFSPDGSTMFVNIQHSSLTLAVSGPWRRG